MQHLGGGATLFTAITGAGVLGVIILALVPRLKSNQKGQGSCFRGLFNPALGR